MHRRSNLVQPWGSYRPILGDRVESGGKQVVDHTEEF